MTNNKANSNGNVTLREVTEADLPTLFEQVDDPEARYMAAFTSQEPESREAFIEHWHRNLANGSNVNRAILVDGTLAGSIACFQSHGRPEVGYWVGREFWGEGVATRALELFLTVVRERPLYAAAAKDNTGSIRVLEKCGFVVTEHGRGYANARGQEIDEVILELK